MHFGETFGLVTRLVDSSAPFVDHALNFLSNEWEGVLMQAKVA